jgi:hypothetical protein
MAMIRQAFGEESTSLHEKSKLAETENGETSDEKSQEHAHHFCDIKGIAHKEFVLTGQTVNSAHYCNILQGMRGKMRQVAVASRQRTGSHFLFSSGNF